GSGHQALHLVGWGALNTISSVHATNGLRGLPDTGVPFALAAGSARGDPQQRRRGAGAEHPGKARPIESRAWIVLAPGRDMLVPGDVGDGIGVHEAFEEPRQRRVLRRLERLAFEPFQL